jgi:hypothetical protein
MHPPRQDDTETHIKAASAAQTAEYPPARGDITVRVDEVKNFFSEQISGLKSHLDVEYRLLNTAIETHGQRIELFWQQHDKCFAANERARHDTRRELEILRDELHNHINGDQTEVMHHHRRHEDSNEMKAAFRIGRKLTTGRLIAASLLLLVLGAAGVAIWWVIHHPR